MKNPENQTNDPESAKRLTPGEKLAVAQGLRDTAWELTAAGVRMRYPDLAESEVQERVREIFLRVVTA